MKFPKLITRRRAKWTGLVATLLLGAAMIASYWYWPTYVWARANSFMDWSVRITPGGVSVHRQGTATKRDLAKPYHKWYYNSRHIQADFYLTLPPGLGINKPKIPLMWLATYDRSGRGPFGMRHLSIPFWMPLALCAVPTVWLFYTDRRAKPRQCAKCRYDLRGLEDGLCPECGADLDVCHFPTH